MLGTEIRLIKTSSQQMSDYPVCETKTIDYVVDCYPYAFRGLLAAILLSTVFWGGGIGVLILVF
jgi:hypothetical protein